MPTGSTLHLFSPTQAYNVLTGATPYILLQWSDPLNASSNDDDLFILDSTGPNILCTSVTTQAGAGATPLEECDSTSSSGYPAGSRIVMTQKAGAARRALHLDTERGVVSIGTTGATFGHNAGLNTVSMAATYWNSARTGTKAFVGGAANPNETFSSDGPRRIFYTPAGAAITPGNLLFGTSGGTLLAKPDMTAADGVYSKSELQVLRGGERSTAVSRLSVRPGAGRR